MLTTLLLTSGLAALAAADDSAQGKGFVKYAVKAQRQSWAGPTRRQSNVDLKNIELGLAYTIELGFGTPAQPVPVQLDTGSVDLWVNPNCAHERNEQAIAFCQTFPRFDWRESSTLVDKNETWPQGYGIGNVTFEWVTDNVAVGGATVKNQQFGVTIDSYSLSLGILGVGPVYTTNPDSHPQYSFFIDSLATQGITASRAFSLDLRSVDSPDGSIIFGGVDTGKYEGALEKLPIIPGKNAPGGADRYWVTLESIDVVPSGEASTSALFAPVPVVLDSGSTLSTFPQDVFETIGAAIPGAAFDSASGFYIVDCAIGDTTGTVDFVFGKKTIKVAFKDFIWEIDTNVCVVGAQGFAPGGEFSFTILGDSFLRAAYAVFDQDNQNIHIAQAINCGTNLVAIGTGPDAVPSITGGCGGTSSTTSASSTSTEPPASSTTEPPASSTTEPPSSSATETSTKSGPHGNATSTYSHRSGRPSHSPTLTSTVTKTSVYTVTSCPPTVTNCPVGHVTTEIITSLTTWCPEAETTTHRGPGIPCLRCTGGFPGETTITTTVKPTPCHKCGETGGETPVPTSTVKPCPTCSGAPTHSTTSGHAVVTAGVGRLMGNAGLAVVVAAALL